MGSRELRWEKEKKKRRKFVVVVARRPTGWLRVVRGEERRCV
jgi:hypothetical protein